MIAVMDRDQITAEVAARAARQVWDSALASSWQQPPVWVHGDVTASNLLLAGGAPHAVIDFGCAAVGDPACDLVMAWTFFPDRAAAVFRRGLPADEATWARTLPGTGLYRGHDPDQPTRMGLGRGGNRPHHRRRPPDAPGHARRAAGMARRARQP